VWTRLWTSYPECQRKNSPLPEGVGVFIGSPFTAVNKIFNYENTHKVSLKDKSLKHEKLHGLFRGFVLSCFRDKKSFSFPDQPDWVLRKAEEK
jgi:hypothetical protein